jgi:hypothetical protein
MDLHSLLLITTLLAAPIPNGEREGTIVAYKFRPGPHELIVMKSNGTIIKQFEPKGIKGWVNVIRLNPAATHVFLATVFQDEQSKTGSFQNGYVLELEKHEQPAAMVFEKLTRIGPATWSTDGTKIYFSDSDPNEINVAKKTDPIPHHSWVIDWNTRKKTEIKLPGDHAIVDLTADGKKLLTMREWESTPDVMSDFARNRAYLASLNDFTPHLIADVPCYPLRLAQDGKSLVGFQLEKSTEKKSGYRGQYVILDVTSKQVTKIGNSDNSVEFLVTPMWNQKGESVYLLSSEKLEAVDSGKPSLRYSWHNWNGKSRQLKTVHSFDLPVTLARFDYR